MGEAEGNGGRRSQARAAAVQGEQKIRDSVGEEYSGKGARNYQQQIDIRMRSATWLALIPSSRVLSSVRQS